MENPENQSSFEFGANQLIMVQVTRLERAVSYSQRIWECFFWAFIAVFRTFRSVLLILWASLNLRFTGVPRLSVVIYVVKNASRPVPVSIHRRRTGSVSQFRVVCIVTLRAGECKCFLRGEQLNV